MKYITLFAIICLLWVSLIGPARAELAIGYETLTVLPHTFTLHSWSKESGWGFKAAADFGMSALALSSRVLNNFFSSDTVDNFYLFSLYGTKDVKQEDNYRSFFKFGGLLLHARVLGKNEMIFVPSLGVGWEWQKLWDSGWAFGVDVAYPELLNIGMRYYLF